MSEKQKRFGLFYIPTPTTANGLDVTVTSTGTLQVNIESLVNTQEAKDQIEAMRDLCRRQASEEGNKSQE